MSTNISADHKAMEDIPFSKPETQHVIQQVEGIELQCDPLNPHRFYFLLRNQPLVTGNLITSIMNSCSSLSASVKQTCFYQSNVRITLTIDKVDELVYKLKLTPSCIINKHLAIQVLQWSLEELNQQVQKVYTSFKKASIVQDESVMKDV